MMRRLLVTLGVLGTLGLVAVALWLHRAQGWPPLAALAFALAIPYVATASLLGLQFALGAWFRAREPEAVRHGFGAALCAWGGELVASLRTFLWMQIRHGAAPLPSDDDGTRTPVLLVHGYVCNHGIWHPFARWLAARGHPVESVDLEPVFGSIDDYVPIIADGVRRLQERGERLRALGERPREDGEGPREYGERLRQHGERPRVAIVAHSMGGVATRAYLAGRGLDDVYAVVTLGSPHAGTWLARFAHGRNVAQMRMGSDWLRALEARESAATGALFTTIWSPHDNIVMPQAASQRLAGATAVAVPGRGHVRLAYDEEVWRIAAEAIDDARC